MVFLPQDHATRIKQRLAHLEQRRYADEYSKRDVSLLVMIEKCNEQNKAIEITTEWIEVCVVHRPDQLAFFTSFLAFVFNTAQAYASKRERRPT